MTGGSETAAVPSPPVRRVAAAALLAVVVLLLAAGPASAHAVLTGATPGDGEALDAAPSEVRLTFNEPVASNDTALRVFDADAERVDDGPAADVPADEVAVALPADLPDGAYVVVYRVVSADSHPIAGAYPFTVGDAQALDADAVAAIAGPGAGTLGTVGSILRGIGYVGTLVAAGAVLAAAVVARGDRDRRRAERIGRPAALLGAVAVLVHLPVQAAAVSGYSLLDALTDPSVLGATLTSGFGQSWLARFAALLALSAPWFVSRAGAGARPARADPAVDGTGGPVLGTGRPLLWLGAAASLALASFLLDGHQRTYEPTWLLALGDAVHLAGAAAWFGGLAVLVAIVRASRLEDDPVGAATVVQRFSRLAVVSVVALAVAGTAMAVPLVRGPQALVSTTYGWLLLAKVALVAVAVGTGAYNQRVLLPAVVSRAVPSGGSVDHAADAGAAGTATASADAWRTLTRTVQVELGLLVAVVAITGFLVTTQPAAEAAGLTGPVTLEAPLDDAIDLSLTVDPAEAGLNTLHLYAFDGTGTLTDEVDEVRLELTLVEQDIGPFTVEPFVAGPGHWTATIEDLRFPGTWEVRVVAGIGRFDEAATTFEVPVR